MRPFLTSLVLIAAAVSASCRPHGQPLTTAAVDTVTVTITCNGDGVQTSITPYNVQVQLGNGVDWVLANSPNVPAISIDKKPGRGWPFVASPPYNGQRDNPARARGMDANARGTYPYSIAAVCTPPGKAPRVVLIDPDMIIIRGGTT